MRYAIGLFLICLLTLNNCATTATSIYNTKQLISDGKYLKNKGIIYSGTQFDLDLAQLFFDSPRGSSVSGFSMVIGLLAMFDLIPSFALDTLLLPITISVVGFLCIYA
jgi:uncharacterized protein YceK